MQFNILLLLVGFCAISWNQVTAENEEVALEDKEQDPEWSDVIPDGAENQDSNDDEDGNADEKRDEGQDDENRGQTADSNEDGELDEPSEDNPDEASINEEDENEDTYVSNRKDPSVLESLVQKKETMFHEKKVVH